MGQQDKLHVVATPAVASSPGSRSMKEKGGGGESGGGEQEPGVHCSRMR